MMLMSAIVKKLTVKKYINGIRTVLIIIIVIMVILIKLLVLIFIGDDNPCSLDSILNYVCYNQLI
jgi:hypothetical protein